MVEIGEQYITEITLGGTKAAEFVARHGGGSVSRNQHGEIDLAVFTGIGGKVETMFGPIDVGFGFNENDGAHEIKLGVEAARALQGRGPSRFLRRVQVSPVTSEGERSVQGRDGSDFRRGRQTIGDGVTVFARSNLLSQAYAVKR